MFENIYDLNQFRQESQKQAALFYFSHENCNVCKVLKPKVAEMIQANFPETGLFYIDINKSPVFAGQLRIFSVPTLLVFFDGKEYFRQSRNIGIEQLKDQMQRPYSMIFA